MILRRKQNNILMIIRKLKQNGDQINILGSIYVTANDYHGATYSYVDARANLVPELTWRCSQLQPAQLTTVGNIEPAWGQVFGELLEQNSNGDIPDYKNWNVTVELTSKNMWLVF